MRLRTSIFTALLSAMLCLLAPISIPVGVVPVSLATFGICLVSLLANRRCALMALLLYISIGVVGLPVFAGFAGGAHMLVGPTGGYIFGYIPMVLCIASHDGKRQRPLRMCGHMAVGLFVCYFFGTGWYSICTGVTVLQAVVVGVLPFLLFDVIKLAAAAVLATLLGDRIHAAASGEQKREKNYDSK